MTANHRPVIKVVAAVVLDPAGRMLVVRKRATSVFMQPGGKMEAGETALQCLHREVREELGTGVARVEPMGCLGAPAAHEPGYDVEAEVFGVALEVEPRPSAEIDELLWHDPSAPGKHQLAPLSVAILGALRRRGPEAAGDPSSRATEV